MAHSGRPSCSIGLTYGARGSGILLCMREFNRTFYKFLFSFMGVIAVTLVLIIIVGTLGA